jgi:hypothetical protein
LHHDAAALDGATDATEQAANAADPDADASVEQESRVDESPSSTEPDASSVKE